MSPFFYAYIKNQNLKNMKRKQNTCFFKLFKVFLVEKDETKC